MSTFALSEDFLTTQLKMSFISYKIIIDLSTGFISPRYFFLSSSLESVIEDSLPSIGRQDGLTRLSLRASAVTSRIVNAFDATDLLPMSPTTSNASHDLVGRDLSHERQHAEHVSYSLLSRAKP